MPEAPMYKDYFFARPEHQIRASRQIFCVKTVSVAHPVHQPTDQHFRLRIPRAHPSHDFRATSGTYAVHDLFSLGQERPLIRHIFLRRLTHHPSERHLLVTSYLFQFGMQRRRQTHRHTRLRLRISLINGLLSHGTPPATLHHITPYWCIPSIVPPLQPGYARRSRRSAVGLAGFAPCLVSSHGHPTLIPDASGLSLRSRPARCACPSVVSAGGCGRSCCSLHRITAFSLSRAARPLRTCVLAAVVAP